MAASKYQAESDPEYVNHRGFFPYVISWLTWRDYPGPPPLLDKPFRIYEELQLNDTKESLESIREEVGKLQIEGDLDFLNCLLVGSTAAGKSSFFNACATALSDDKEILRPFTVLRSTQGKSVTQFIETAPIYIEKTKCNPRQRETLKLHLFDCRGLNDLEEVPINDVKLFVDGHIKNKYKVTKGRQISESDPFYRSNPTMADKMHCVIYVLDAVQASAIMDSKVVSDTFKELREKLSVTHVPQLVLMTKSDNLRASFCHEEELRKIFQSQEVKHKISKVSQLTCIDECDVMPQVNYGKDPHSSNVKDILTLINLRKVMKRANKHVEMYQDRLT